MTTHQGSVEASGRLGLAVIGANGIERDPARPGKTLETAREARGYMSPQAGLSDRANEWRKANLRESWPKTAAMFTARRAGRRVSKLLGVNVPILWSQLWLAVIDTDGIKHDLGLAGVRVVTDAGVNAIVDAFQNTFEVETFNFHGIGTGNTAEASGDTALDTESTTALNPDNTRATGAQGEGASANIYQTVATNAVDAAVACVEHGIFDQAATGGGVLLDRTVFAVVNLANGESLQSTYELTVASGG